MSPVKTNTACPGCGYVRQTRNSAILLCNTCKRGTGTLPDGAMDFMLAEAARMRAEGPSDYAIARAKRRPWISRAEAAIELNLSQPRISQLISRGILAHRKDPDRLRAKQVSASDVYNYNPRPLKKKAAATT